MAGGYTHLTLVRCAITQATNKVESQNPQPTASDQALADILERWGRYAYLGGVSPDYPYLGLDADWADLMHKGRTNEIIAHALPLIFAERTRAPADHGWQQQCAWILGFITHVIADVVIHPVVNIKVGKYEENKEAHRRCEMNQDVWIYRQKVHLDLHYSDNMKGEIKGCGRPFDLDDGVEQLWADCLEKTYNRRPGEDQIDKWHAAFLSLVDFAEDARKIPVFGRHLVSGAAAYPDKQDEQAEFYGALDVPTGKAVNHDEQPTQFNEKRRFVDIFDKTLRHIEEAWTLVVLDLFSDPQTLGSRHSRVLGNWSLDTGIDVNTRQLRLWPWNERLAL